jgi:hypothetical protein
VIKAEITKIFSNLNKGNLNEVERIFEKLCASKCAVITPFGTSTEDDDGVKAVMSIFRTVDSTHPDGVHSDLSFISISEDYIIAKYVFYGTCVVDMKSNIENKYLIDNQNENVVAHTTSKSTVIVHTIPAGDS